MAVKDLLSDTLMVSGVKWCPVIDEVLYIHGPKKGVLDKISRPRLGLLFGAADEWG